MPAIEATLNLIFREYGKQGRYYHNLEHLQELFAHFHQNIKELIHPDLVAFALFFHDLIYVPGRQDNESRSADQAVRHLDELGLPADDTGWVAACIRATQTHTLPDASDTDMAWVLDFDLAILGTEWERYQEYSRKIRQEYRIFPDLLYKPGRRRVLEKLLKRPSLYHMESFRVKYESVARENILRELLLLG
ncbi:MAG: hypothetical protein EP344_09475 [Bacteroidetes bacterium]|nr:MAG: hypothetical protein EP344_09475 [Bacteroidota bacterium]